MFLSSLLALIAFDPVIEFNEVRAALVLCKLNFCSFGYVNNQLYL